MDAYKIRATNKNKNNFSLCSSDNYNTASLSEHLMKEMKGMREQLLTTHTLTYVDAYMHI